MSITILHITDSHSGLMAGLIAKGTELVYDNGDKRTVLLSSMSEWVLECFNRVIDSAIDFAGSDPVIVYHTGDTCHGNAFSEYLYSAWQDHQVTIAVGALSMLRRIQTLAGIRFAYGTDKHDYGENSATKAVADQCAAWGYPMECVSHGAEEIDGCLVDFAHHGPSVGKGEDKNSGGRRYTIRLVRTFLERNQRAPDIILRGHFHQRVTEPVVVSFGRVAHNVMLSIGAPLCGFNSYSRKATSSAPLCEVGGTLIRVNNGHVVDWQAATWEHENRVHIQGVDFYKFRHPGMAS
jgi:hypothetical protein